MLKPEALSEGLPVLSQPPSGGCVLKLQFSNLNVLVVIQPPSGGCVLKPVSIDYELAANGQPPSGGCVLKHMRALKSDNLWEPAAFGRLCVETIV